MTKTDGSVVDVHLDKAFNVLGTSKADQGQDDHGDHADQGDGDGEDPTA